MVMTDKTTFNRPPHPAHGAIAGGDATEAMRGQDAGDVQLALTYERRQPPGIVVAIGGAAGPAGGSTQSLHDRPRKSDTSLSAPGGKGGNGGRGGDGGPGSQGYRGRNATRFTSGTNGGPGGDGGDAGEPSDGKPGGEGGDVVVTVDQNDQGLLMLVKGNLVGGDLGFAGEVRPRRRGGPGGRGGSSYHWTESQTYRDSQGRTQTRTIMRSNPGGVDGPSGRDGSPSRYRATDAYRVRTDVFASP